MATIERGDRAQTQPFRNRDQAGINPTEVLIGVPLSQLCDAQPIRR